MENVEFIITVRCKTCGEIISLRATVDSDKEKKEAKHQIDKFTAEHKHSPWTV